MSLELSRRWGLALAALPLRTRGLRLDVLGGAPREPGSSATALRHLRAVGVGDRSRLLDFLRRNSGPGRAHGWAHSVAVAGWAAQAEWIDEEDAWQLIFDIGRNARSECDSWEAFAELTVHDLDGLSDGRASCRTQIDQLLDDPESPFRTLPWEVELPARSPPVPGPETLRDLEALASTDEQTRVDGFMDLHDALFAGDSLAAWSGSALEPILDLLGRAEVADADWLLIMLSDLVGDGDATLPWSRALATTARLWGRARRCVDSPDPRTRAAAGLALGSLRVPDQMTLTLLEARLRDEVHPAARASKLLAMGSLSGRGSGEASVALRAGLSAAEPVVRISSAIALVRADPRHLGTERSQVLALLREGCTSRRQPIVFPWFDGHLAIGAAEALVTLAHDDAGPVIDVLAAALDERRARGEPLEVRFLPHRFQPDAEERRAARALVTALVDIALEALPPSSSEPDSEDLPLASRRALEALHRAQLWDAALVARAPELEAAGLWVADELGRLLGLVPPGPLDRRIELPGGERLPAWRACRRYLSGQLDESVLLSACHRAFDEASRQAFAQDVLAASYAPRARRTVLGERPEELLSKLLE